MNAYQMVVNNVARFIRDNPATDERSAPIDAFSAASVLSVGFCKSKEEILMDIVAESDKNEKLKSLIPTYGRKQYLPKSSEE